MYPPRSNKSFVYSKKKGAKFEKAKSNMYMAVSRESGPKKSLFIKFMIIDLC